MDHEPAQISDSIRSSFDSDSKITSKRASQSKEHFEHSSVTDIGMQIEDSDELPANTSDAIRSSFKSDSKATSRRAAQCEKQLGERNITHFRSKTWSADTSGAVGPGYSERIRRPASCRACAGIEFRSANHCPHAPDHGDSASASGDPDESDDSAAGDLTLTL
jgi:hypothetical protein